MRTEQEIFDDLAALCLSKGYIHALAAICFRDNVIGFGDELKPENMEHLFSHSRLIRTEVTTLIGLMMRGPIDFSLPPQEKISDYGARSDALLEELHQAMLKARPDLFSPDKLKEPDFNPFKYGDVLREAIFYGGESAHPFQYRDLAPLKYGADADWLKRNKGIELDVAQDVCRGIATLLNARLMDTLTGLRDKPLAEWTMLDGFAFSSEEIAARIGQPIESVSAVVEAFTAPQDERNVTFKSLHDFNSAYAYPFIRRGPDEFVLLQQYGIAEALYETPFYWMGADKAYCDTALRHRGDFTEAFAAERLKHVFGAERVFQNVEIFKQKGQAAGEIDVLVLFGNRAIILQAKSKKLTLPARKGNDLELQADFKAAVQDAVDQAIACAELLGEPSVTLRCRDGATIALAEPLRTVFPVTIVVDHYPALAFQARQFLAAKTSEAIAAPLVTDVFALDAMTEMLSSPLRLLSYLSARARFGDKLMMSHEHTVLSYHLKRNLWIKEDIGGVLLQDDLSMELDIAMAARRDGIAGAMTPDGILTRFRGTHFSRIVDAIEDEPAPVAIDLGLMLLELSEDTVRDLNRYITQILASTAADAKLHDVTIAAGSSGLTIHCSRLPREEAEFRLRSHCTMRKYLAKASSWFGLALALDGSIKFIAELLGAWKFDPALEAACAGSSMLPMNGTNKEAGRNDPCPCGSGKKYKRCCLSRQ